MTTVTETQPAFTNCTAKDVLIDIDWTQIVNIGEKIWQIIKEGKPVVSVTAQVAHAVPGGINCWLEMENWQMPSSKLYHVYYKNMYGIDVVDFQFRLNYIAGGSYRGRGKYLANVSIQPSSLNVKWGFTFNAKATVPIVFNAGTSDNPMAAMQVNIEWEMQNPFVTEQKSLTFFVRGDGHSEQLQ